MKKIWLFFLSLLYVATTGYAENLVIENQTSYPVIIQKSRIAVQWANSAKEADEGNKALIYGTKLNPETLVDLSESGKVTLNVPEKAECFRVVVWSKGEGGPDLVTNWVDIVPNKSYTLHDDHLVPVVLMSGTGC